MSAMAQSLFGFVWPCEMHVRSAKKSKMSTMLSPSKSNSARPSESRNLTSLVLSTGESAANAAALPAPSPNGPCAAIAAVTRAVKDPPAADPSCNIGSRRLTPQSVGVRISASPALPSLIPSASRPMSCRRKSQYGRMVLLRIESSSEEALDVVNCET